ncbi:MAG: aspartate/glutamate racemase [Gammaproteobacteria bacterium]|jgi:aspartate/glutamate racemase
MIVTGGTAYQGYSVGIMKFEGRRYPLPPGDVANPTTYPFPVLIREIPGVDNNPYPPLTNSDGSYTEVVQKCIDEAIRLEQEGVNSIAMCCGFFSLIQPIIAAAVSIPVLTSPLIMIPVIHQMLKPEQSLVVVTASKKLLSGAFFTAIGADINHRIIVAGLDDSEVFNSMCMGGKAISYETDHLRDDVIGSIQQAQKFDPNIGAILLECTSLPPFAVDVKEQTGLPVFDFIACVEWMNRALMPIRYTGQM